MVQMIQIHSIRLTYAILILVIEAALGQTNVKSSRNPSCNSLKCSCCLATSPCTSTNTNCFDQCKKGYYGGTCLDICPSNCIRCTNHPDIYISFHSTYCGKGYCTECKNGNYSTSEFYQCQLECPTGCQTCYSDTNCTSCSDGYFKEGTTCKRCKSGCNSCTSSNDCTQCQGGYFNSGSSVNNLNCVYCSEGCSDQCDQTTGTCNCIPYFTGEKCDKCVDGRYGTSCNNLCSSPCKACNSFATECTTCITGYVLQGTTCSLCKPECADCSTYDVCTLCMDGYYSSGTDCALVKKDGDGEDGPPRAVIGGGVAGGIVIIGVVTVLIVIFRKRLCSRSDDSSRSSVGIPTYINVHTPGNKTPENTQAVEDISRKLQKYQDKHHKHQQEYQQQHQEYQQKYQKQQQEYQKKEAKYTQKLEQIQIQLNEMRSQPDNRDIKDDVISGTVNTTYESLDLQQAGDQPYAALGNRSTS